MARWQVIDQQTREHLGEVTGDHQEAALRLARQDFGNDGERYVGVTLHPLERPPTIRPTGFLIDHEEAEAALLEWAKSKRGLPDGFLAKIQILTRLKTPRVLVEFYDTKEVPVPGVHYDEGPAVGENEAVVATAEMREGEEMIPVELVVRTSGKSRKY